MKTPKDGKTSTLQRTMSRIEEKPVGEETRKYMKNSKRFTSRGTKDRIPMSTYMQTKRRSMRRLWENKIRNKRMEENVKCKEKNDNE